MLNGLAGGHDVGDHPLGYALGGHSAHPEHVEPAARRGVRLGYYRANLVCADINADDYAVVWHFGFWILDFGFAKVSAIGLAVSANKAPMQIRKSKIQNRIVLP